LKNAVLLALVASLTGCASWCDNSEDREKCLNRVHVAQAVGAAVAVVGVVALAARGGGGGGTTDNSYKGNCQYDWQIAADGSRCGLRSAESRPGGF